MNSQQLRIDDIVTILVDCATEYDEIPPSILADIDTNILDRIKEVYGMDVYNLVVIAIECSYDWVEHEKNDGDAGAV